MIAVLRSTNVVDTSELHMNYMWKVLGFFQELCRKSGSIKKIGRYLFVKLTKLLAVLYVMSEMEEVTEFREDCSQTLVELWRMDAS